MNIQKLKAKIVENGMTQRDFAIKIGVSPQNLSKKLNGNCYFSINQCKKTIGILHLNMEEAYEIFFGKEVEIS